MEEEDFIWYVRTQCGHPLTPVESLIATTKFNGAEADEVQENELPTTEENISTQQETDLIAFDESNKENIEGEHSSEINSNINGNRTDNQEPENTEIAHPNPEEPVENSSNMEIHSTNHGQQEGANETKNQENINDEIKAEVNSEIQGVDNGNGEDEKVAANTQNDDNRENSSKISQTSATDNGNRADTTDTGNVGENEENEMEANGTNSGNQFDHNEDERGSKNTKSFNSNENANGESIWKAEEESSETEQPEECREHECVQCISIWISDFDTNGDNGETRSLENSVNDANIMLGSTTEKKSDAVSGTGHVYIRLVDIICDKESEASESTCEAEAEDNEEEKVYTETKNGESYCIDENVASGSSSVMQSAGKGNSDIKDATENPENSFENVSLEDSADALAEEDGNASREIVEEPTQQTPSCSSSSHPGIADLARSNVVRFFKKPPTKMTKVLVSKTAGEDAAESITEISFPTALLPKKPARAPKPEGKGFFTSHTYRGIACALLCSFFYSLCCLIVSQLITVRHYGASYCFFWRFLGVCLPGVGLQIYYSLNKVDVFQTIWPPTKNYKPMPMLVMRVLMGILSIVLHYMALKYIEIGDAATIVFSNPVVVTMIAWFFLKESMGCVPIVVSLFTVLGVAIITKPTFIWDDRELDADRALGVGLACGSMVCNALVFISLRSLRDVHFSVSSLIFGTVGLLWGILETQIANEWKWPDVGYELWDFFLLISLAIASFVAQLLLTLSLKFEDAGPVSGIRTFDVVFSFGWQCIAQHVPDMLSLLGASIVITSVGVILFRKYLIGLPDDDPKAKRFWFLMK